MMISASNGKHFLINTYDNKTGQDYDDYQGGCRPGAITSKMEVACGKA